MLAQVMLGTDVIMRNWWSHFGPICDPILTSGILTWKILKYKLSKSIVMPTFPGLWDRLDVRRTGWQSPCIQEHSAAKMATSDVLRIKVHNQSRRPTPCSITTHLQSCSFHYTMRTNTDSCIIDFPLSIHMHVQTGVPVHFF